MHLTNFKISNFKTYTDLDVDFCSNVNCLVGNNGVGKTNLLDAIYYLSFCKSYFNAIDSQNIRQGEEFFAIHGNYAFDQEQVLVSCVEKKGQPKQMRWNKKAYKTFGEHIGRIPLVIISPNDQNIIQGGSEVRRKFVDGVISQTDKTYLDHLLQYQKALDQRNRLLKQFYEDRYWDEPSIAIWDEQLARHGDMLYQGRQAFLKEFLPLFAQYFSWITNSSEQAVLNYVGKGDVPLQQQLTEARQNDKYAQYTTVGPHKDDLELLIGDFAVKKYGSQGQQKTFVLALKLAQFEYIYQRCGQKPILLLDDIFDKLDMLRVTQLVQLVGSDRFGQVFLTDTQPGRVEHIFAEIPQVEHKIFNVTRGELTLMEG
ncbi:MAG: DNA replication/repair protein RecF [Bacteroidales bacterium]|nr:DNA replication/repair protein RecF [Bacteroidales bacterium]